METKDGGKNHFDEDLTGQVENRVQERKDLSNVWAAFGADALRTPRETAE